MAKNQTAIRAFLQGSCTLIFLLSGVPGGIELMSRDIADGYAPATALGDANVSLLLTLPGGDRSGSQPPVPQRKKEPEVGGSRNLSDNKNQTQTLGTTQTQDFVPHPVTH